MRSKTDLIQVNIISGIEVGAFIREGAYNMIYMVLFIIFFYYFFPQVIAHILYTYKALPY